MIGLFKGYIPFIVITKYWLHALYYIVCPCKNSSSVLKLNKNHSSCLERRPAILDLFGLRTPYTLRNYWRPQKTFVYMGCIYSYYHIRHFFFLLFWLPRCIWSSWASDQSWAPVETYAPVVAMLDLWPTVQDWRSNLHLCASEMLLILLLHSGNSTPN